jgi:glycosyltransferase involved in cell wall biosynthesis
MTRELAREGHDVSVITTNIDGPGVLDVPVNEYIERDGVHVCYCAVERPRQWCFSRYMWSLLKADVPKCDVVHIHSLFLWPTASAVQVCLAHHTPYIIRPAGALDLVCLTKEYEPLGWIDRFKKALYLRFRGSHELSHASAIHFTSELEKTSSWLPENSPPGVIVPLGVEPGRVTPGRFTPLRQKFPQLGAGKLVLFLSRLDPKKGLDLLLSSIADLLERRQDFGFVIAGSGPAAYQEQIRTSICHPEFRNRVVMIGEVYADEKWDVLNQADLFILPSHQENFGLAVVEAMAAGVPVVISDAVNIHREIVRANAGAVTAIDRSAIARTIDSLLSDDAGRRQMGGNGRRLVEERYTWKEVVRQLVDVYTDIDNSRRGPRNEMVRSGHGNCE